MKRPGYYVEGKFFGSNFHQARARAAFLAREYGRGIDVWREDVDRPGEAALVMTVHNGRKAA